MTVRKPNKRYGWSGQDPEPVGDPVDSSGLTVGSRCKHYLTGEEGTIRRLKRVSNAGDLIWAVDFDDGLLDANQREGTMLPL